MEEVSDEIAIELEEQNEEMAAKLAALESENEELKAKVAAMETEEEPAAEGELEEEEAPAPVPAAKRRGCAPVAQGPSKNQPSARVRWESAIKAHMDNGLPRNQAAVRANKENPGLRDAYILEANS